MSNSIDATASRDFLTELASALAHHRRCTCPHRAKRSFSWSTQEFGFVELDDAFATGSSMMPQKKNPDAAELVRGRARRVIGDLVSLLTLEKGLPSGITAIFKRTRRRSSMRWRRRDISIVGAGGALATATFRIDPACAAALGRGARDRDGGR